MHFPEDGERRQGEHDHERAEGVRECRRGTEAGVIVRLAGVDDARRYVGQLLGVDGGDHAGRYVRGEDPGPGEASDDAAGDGAGAGADV